jgi:CheY-like chemotaxis protein
MSERLIEIEQEAIDIEDPELLAELDAAMEEADRSDGMDAFEFLRQLRQGTWRADH